MIEYVDERNLTPEERHRLEKYGSTLSADNLARLIEHIEDYPEVIAAVHALEAPGPEHQ